MHGRNNDDDDEQNIIFALVLVFNCDFSKSNIILNLANEVRIILSASALTTI